MKTITLIILVNLLSGCWAMSPPSGVETGAAPPWMPNR
jgi:hypothetical protein